MGGGLVLVTSILWYLFREDDTENDGDDACRKTPAQFYFKVVDKDGFGIGVRAEPDMDPPRRKGQKLLHNEVFSVAEILESEPPQRYLRLADGRGWVFTHSRLGQEIAREISWEQAMAELD